MPLKRLAHQRVPHTSAQAGLETRQLVQRLSTCDYHDLVTYAEMQELTGVDVQERRDLLNTARRIVQHTYGKVFDVENNVGLVCLTEREKVGYGESRTQRIARASIKNVRMLETVDMAQLSPEEKLRHNAQITVNAAVHLYTHEKTLSQLVGGTPLPPPPTFDRDAHARLAQLWAEK